MMADNTPEWPYTEARDFPNVHWMGSSSCPGGHIFAEVDPHEELIRLRFGDGLTVWLTPWQTLEMMGKIVAVVEQLRDDEAWSPLIQTIRASSGGV